MVTDRRGQTLHRQLMSRLYIAARE